MKVSGRFFTDTQHKIKETLREIGVTHLLHFHGLLKYCVEINGNFIVLACFTVQASCLDLSYVFNVLLTFFFFFTNP